MKVGKGGEAGLEKQRVNAQAQDLDLREQVLAALQKAAKNGNGKVSRKEIIAAVRDAQKSRQANASDQSVPENSKFRQELKEHLALLDRNADGEVSVRKANKAMKRADNELQNVSTSTSESDYQDRLKVQLNRFSTTRSAQYTERESFAAQIATSVEELAGSKGLFRFYQRFNEALLTEKGQSRKGLVYAANRALKFTRVKGFFDADTAHEIRSEAFGASQFDANKLKMGNVRPAQDAKFALDLVLDDAETTRARYDSGEEHALNRPERKQLKKDLLGEN